MLLRETNSLRRYVSSKGRTVNLSHPLPCSHKLASNGSFYASTCCNNGHPHFQCIKLLEFFSVVYGIIMGSSLVFWETWVQVYLIGFSKVVLLFSCGLIKSRPEDSFNKDTFFLGDSRTRTTMVPKRHNSVWSRWTVAVQKSILKINLAETRGKSSSFGERKQGLSLDDWRLRDPNFGASWTLRESGETEALGGRSGEHVAASWIQGTREGAECEYCYIVWEEKYSGVSPNIIYPT